MIEKICPIHNVPVFGEKCPMRECDARPIVSTTVYWCAKCRIPSFEKTCAVCGDGCDYMTTDVRPVFPEEKLLLGILLDEDDPHSLENASVWNSSSGYYVDGRRVELAVQEINAMPLNQVAKIKSRYDREYQNIDRTYFDGMIERFIECNKERYLQITDEAISYIQSFEDRYSKEEMYISFSGGKDSTVTSDLVTKAFASNKIIHIFGDTTLEFPLTYDYRERFAKTHMVIRARNHEKNFEDLMLYHFS